MTTNVEEIVAAIRGGKGLPWSDEKVYEQKEHFFPATWRAKWPEGTPLAPYLRSAEAGSPARRDVTRREIFNAAEKVATPEDALDLYVLMCGWGAGFQGLTSYRCQRPLSDPGIATKLFDSYQAIRGGADPVDVYRDLQSGGFKIKYFGPAFFTKWIYFVGYELPDTTHPKPLILDSRVATTLGWKSWGWTPEEYRRYLCLAAEVAERLGVEPHVVEHALYALRGDVVIDEPEAGLRSIVVNGVPEEVRTQLERQAAAHGRTFEDYVLKVLIDATEQPSR